MNSIPYRRSLPTHLLLLLVTCLGLSAPRVFCADVSSLQPVVTTNYLVVTNIVVVTNYVTLPSLAPVTNQLSTLNSQPSTLNPQLSTLS